MIVKTEGQVFSYFFKFTKVYINDLLKKCKAFLEAFFDIFFWIINIKQKVKFFLKLSSALLAPSYPSLSLNTVWCYCLLYLDTLTPLCLMWYIGVYTGCFAVQQRQCRVTRRDALKKQAIMKLMKVILLFFNLICSNINMKLFGGKLETYKL